MGWLRRRKEKIKISMQSREVDDALKNHLEQFISSRKGVEIWVEAETSFNKPTILLVAADGEWTRRAIPSSEYAHVFARKHGIPSYDAGVMPYPKRMREYDLKNRPPKKPLG